MGAPRNPIGLPQKRFSARRLRLVKLSLREWWKPPEYVPESLPYLPDDVLVLCPPALSGCHSPCPRSSKEREPNRPPVVFLNDRIIIIAIIPTIIDDESTVLYRYRYTACIHPYKIHVNIYFPTNGRRYQKRFSSRADEESTGGVESTWGGCVVGCVVNKAMADAPVRTDCQH